ncbi:DUF2249 domain-containing protein [Halarchaeum sp. P4]|uniref:DUF2249 domain-containing protein n=1 Tax=Halarchaeum sp. P4 TaxID=3421639 RepID=UPI003EBCEC86
MATDDFDGAVDATDAPADRPRDVLDVRQAPPPEPLTTTLERLAALDGETVLVQVNDRAPQHLYPKLEDRGWTYETLERDDDVVTIVWQS